MDYTNKDIDHLEENFFSDSMNIAQSYYLYYKRIFSQGLVIFLFGIFSYLSFFLPEHKEKIVLNDIKINNIEIPNVSIDFISDKITDFNPGLKSEYLSKIILKESLKNDLDPLVITSLIRAESSFNNFARSSVGARGLMQLMPDTAKYIADKENIKWRGVRALYDSEYNVELGVLYYKYLKEKFDGRDDLTLMAYNWGPGRLNKALNRNSKIYSPVFNYAANVLNTHKKWQIELFFELA